MSRRQHVIDAEPQPVPMHVPGFSIELLGRQLALAEHRDILLDTLQAEIGLEPSGPGCPTDATRLRQRQVGHANRAASDHVSALHDLIMNSRPVTLADVVVQLMVLGAWLEQMDGSERGIELAKTAGRVVGQAVRCLGEHAGGASLAELGGANLAGACLDEWPDIDLSRVVHGGDPAWRRAMDGSVTEWDR